MKPKICKSALILRSSIADSSKKFSVFPAFLETLLYIFWHLEKGNLGLILYRICMLFFRLKLYLEQDLLSSQTHQASKFKEHLKMNSHFKGGWPILETLYSLVHWLTKIERYFSSFSGTWSTSISYYIVVLVYQWINQVF